MLLPTVIHVLSQGRLVNDYGACSGNDVIVTARPLNSELALRFL